MESLYAEAAACTQGEERARTLMESIRQQATTATVGRMEFAAKLAQQAILELETRAVEVDGLLEQDPTQRVPPFVCWSLATLETMDKQFTRRWDGELLEEAAKHGDVQLVDLLIQAGVDPSANDNEGLLLASKYGHLPVVNRLLQDERVDPSVEDNYAIRWACCYGHLSVVDRLLQDKRVNPAARDNYAIQTASENGHLSVVNRLLQDERVDPSAYNNYCINFAAGGGHLSVVDRLLQDERVDPADFAILPASDSGHLHVVERLLQDERVDPTINDNDAIGAAYENGYTSVVTRLLQDARVTSSLSDERLSLYRSCL